MAQITAKYCVIYWEKENLYSFESVKNIQDFDKSETAQYVDCIGKTKLIQWGSSALPGKIVAFGTKRQMRNKEVELSLAASEKSFQARDSDAECESQRSNVNLYPISAESRSEKRKLPASSDNNRNKKLAVHTAVESLNPIEFALDAADGNLIVQVPGSVSERSNEVDVLSTEDEILRLRREIALKDAKLEEKTHENRSLKRALRKSAKRTDAESNTEVELIGGNISVSKAFLDYTRLCYNNRPAIFIRRLVFDSKIFSLEEIASSSITGRASSSSPEVIRPPLDPRRLKIIKDFAMANCRIDDGEFMRIVRQIPSDARKKLKSRKSVTASLLAEESVY